MRRQTTCGLHGRFDEDESGEITYRPYADIHHSEYWYT